MKPWKHKFVKFRIGMRTVKSAVAVMIAMGLVSLYGVTASPIIFAVLGAMDAMQPTFNASMRACLTQIIGVISGAVLGLLLTAIGLHPLLNTGIGIVLVISIYNMLGIRFSPSLPCLIVVTICTTPDIMPIAYALGRIWDTLIGFGVGMVINVLVFPYDNRKQIRFTIEGLDRELLKFLEEMFDGDDIMPDAQQMSAQVRTMAAQLMVFSNQKLLGHLKRQQDDIRAFEVCEGKATELLSRMQILSRMDSPGLLTQENKDRLEACGAHIRDTRVLTAPQERDIVVNYHIKQILHLREELLAALQQTE